MTIRNLLVGVSAVALVGIILALADRAPAQQGSRPQVMTEMPVSPNLNDAGSAGIPRHYGQLRGLENVGRSTMLWFEADDGTIRRVQVSFWDDEVILDDQAVTIRRQ